MRSMVRTPPSPLPGTLTKPNPIGYPPCSEIIPVYCKEDGVDIELRGIKENGNSPMGDKIKEKRAKVFPFHYGNGDKYIDMNLLLNKEGTGLLQQATKKNLETYIKVRKEREKSKN